MRRLKRLYFYRKKEDREDNKHINDIDNETAAFWSFIIWEYTRLSNYCEHAFGLELYVL